MLDLQVCSRPELTCCKQGCRDNRVVFALACRQLDPQSQAGNEIQACYNAGFNLTACGGRPDSEQRLDIVFTDSGRRHGLLATRQTSTADCTKTFFRVCQMFQRLQAIAQAPALLDYSLTTW